VCAQPNNKIYSYEGTMRLSYDMLEVGGETISIRNDHVLLRGMTLENTSHLIGIVVYAGNDTKI
jgi:hypothetical protein